MTAQRSLRVLMFSAVPPVAKEGASSTEDTRARRGRKQGRTCDGSVRIGNIVQIVRSCDAGVCRTGHNKLPGRCHHVRAPALSEEQRMLAPSSDSTADAARRMPAGRSVKCTRKCRTSPVFEVEADTVAVPEAALVRVAVDLHQDLTHHGRLREVFGLVVATSDGSACVCAIDRMMTSMSGTQRGRCGGMSPSS